MIQAGHPAHYRNRTAVRAACPSRIWVDDRDLGSKRIFSFLMVFSSIAETGVVPQVPVLTIPAN